MLISLEGSLELLSSWGEGNTGPSWYGSSSWLSGQLGFGFIVGGGLMGLPLLLGFP